MELVVYDDDDRPYVPWRVVISALLVLAAVVGTLTFLLGRSVSTADEITGVGVPEPATAPSAAAGTASPEADTSARPTCFGALAQADATLERAQQIERALAEHTRLMDELIAQRLEAEQLVDQSLPVLTRGATERRRFAEELQAYELARQACPDR